MPSANLRGFSVNCDFVVTGMNYDVVDPIFCYMRFSRSAFGSLI